MSTPILHDVCPIADRLKPAPEGKSIVYDRLTRDFAYFIDGIYIGHAPTYGDAEQRADEVRYDQLTHTQVVSADIEADVAADHTPDAWAGYCKGCGAYSSNLKNGRCPGCRIPSVDDGRVAVFGDGWNAFSHELSILARHIKATAPDAGWDICEDFAMELLCDAQFGKVAA